MNTHVKHTTKLKSPFQLMLSDLIVFLDSAIKLDEANAPRCPCCGEIENLRSGWSGGNLIWLCPDAAREMEYER